METQARYLLVGLFTLAVIAAGFGFVFWLHNAGGLGERATYRVQFESSVPGLRIGSSVLFNGIRVGEVTDLALSSADPRQVIATIVVRHDTPIRQDTLASVETQGLMAAPSVTLRGGSRASQPLSAAGNLVPILKADPAAGKDTMTVAREVLLRVDSILTDNAAPLRETLANVKTFSEALARNADRIDGILTGIERMTGAGAAPPPPAVYDLTAPRAFPDLGALPTGQLAIMEPSVTLALDTQRIVIAAAPGEPNHFSGVQWSDSIPKLFQVRVLQSFENVGLVGVSRPGEVFAPDQQLMLDIRRFQFRPGARTAEIEFGAKLMTREGRILAGKTFNAEARAGGEEAAAAAAGLDQAFGKAVVELVSWTVSGMRRAEQKGTE